MNSLKIKFINWLVKLLKIQLPVESHTTIIEKEIQVPLTNEFKGDLFIKGDLNIEGNLEATGNITCYKTNK